MEDVERNEVRKMEDFKINLDEIEELENASLPSGGSGFGCTCSTVM